MPNLAAGHDKFWRARGNVPPPPTVMVPGAYPPWQSSVISLVIFGPPLEWLARAWARVCWTLLIAWRAWRWPPQRRRELAAWLDRLMAAEAAGLVCATDLVDARLHGERLAVMTGVLGLVTDPAYLWAQVAVRSTATTLGFSERSLGLAYKHVLEKHAGRRDNLMRHVRAVELLREAAQQAQYPLTQAQADFLIAVAYYGFTTQDERPNRRIEPRTIMVS